MATATTHPKILKYHPTADLFPLLQGEEFNALVADIKANGLRRPIVLHPDGSILDGRNRYLACLEAGVVPRFETWDGKGTELDFVISENVRRRMLTPSQRAVIALDLIPFFEAEARERQGTRTDIQEKLPESSRGQSRDKAAAAVEVNPRYVSDAKRIAKDRPDLLKAILSGTKTISDAMRELQPIIIDPEFRNILPALDSATYAVLEGSIKKYGCYTSLVLWKGKNILLDGHWRYAICQEHNIPFNVVYVECADRDAAAGWIMRNQLGRKNLNPEQVSFTRGRLFNSLMKRAEKGDTKAIGAMRKELEARKTKAKKGDAA